MNLISKVNGKTESFSKMFHDYSITKEQVLFYVVGMESWFEHLKGKQVLFKLTDEENEISMFLKGNVKLDCCCDAIDGMSGLYILVVTEWEQLNNDINKGER